MFIAEHFLFCVLFNYTVGAVIFLTNLPIQIFAKSILPPALSNVNLANKSEKVKVVVSSPIVNVAPCQSNY